LEEGETVEEAASRELTEETGLRVPWTKFRKFAYTDDHFGGDTGRYITLYLTVRLDEHHRSQPFFPKVMEPDKCERWEWLRPENIPGELFLPVHNLLRELFFRGL